VFSAPIPDDKSPSHQLITGARSFGPAGMPDIRQYP
jgi:hypothetical protein